MCGPRNSHQSAVHQPWKYSAERSTIEEWAGMSWPWTSAATLRAEGSLWFAAERGAVLLEFYQQASTIRRVLVQPSNLSDHFRSTAQIQLRMEIAAPSSRLPPYYISHDKDGCCVSGRHLRVAESGRAVPWCVPHLSQVVDECVRLLHPL